MLLCVHSVPISTMIYLIVCLLLTLVIIYLMSAFPLHIWFRVFHEVAVKMSGEAAVI